MKFKQLKENKNIGYGNNQGGRFMNKDGSHNVIRTGLPFRQLFNVYDYLLLTTWAKFFLVLFSCYLGLTLFYASFHFMLGSDGIEGFQVEDPITMFLHCFFFSAQALTSLGYGWIAPKGLWAQFLISLESLTGTLAFAIITGLLYGRFSRPTPQIIYSKNMLISPYQNGKALMFRLVNSKPNKPTGFEILVQMTIYLQENGKMERKFFVLDLERNKVDFLPLSWTVVHPITENSPLFGLTKEDYTKGKAEFFVLLSFYDDIHSQNLQSTTSYLYTEMVCDAKFVPAFEKSEDGNHTILNLEKLDKYEKI
jgi:inward rectifier potassium channel